MRVFWLVPAWMILQSVYRTPLFMKQWPLCPDCCCYITQKAQKHCSHIYQSFDSHRFQPLTGILWVHVRGVEAKVDEERNGHSILKPLHHIRLSVQGVGHVASQDDALSCACRHKLGLLSHAVSTWRDHMDRLGWSTSTFQHRNTAYSPSACCKIYDQIPRSVSKCSSVGILDKALLIMTTLTSTTLIYHNCEVQDSFMCSQMVRKKTRKEWAQFWL